VPTIVLLAALLALADAPGDAVPPPRRGPDVSGSRHDTSPPLREIPPARRHRGKKVHPVKPLPRPPPEPGEKPKPPGDKPEAPGPADPR
jgi:hypothetical protein